MVAGAVVIALFILLGLAQWVLWKKRPYESRRMLYLMVVLGFASLVIYELGWVTDEVGRFPYIVYDVLTVNAAANTSTSLFIPGLLIVVFYLVLVPATFYFYSRVFNAGLADSDARSEKGGAYN
jgi:cytochrome d ubiquinol oxidase subunit I